MRILQIVPRAPGSQDGVGDYAETLARHLRKEFNLETVFIASRGCAENAKLASRVNSLDSLQAHLSDASGIVLHFVNYGYQSRGVPLSLVRRMRDARTKAKAPVVTIFHELYATAPPWSSAFWLKPVQIQITKALSRLSDACIVTNDIMAAQLQYLNPKARIAAQPVCSNFGEPELDGQGFARRSLKTWAICGGTIAVARSLKTFLQRFRLLPEHCRPSELHILGGSDNPVVRRALERVKDFSTSYRPNVSLDEASALLRSSGCGWIDYFRDSAVPPSVLLKSTAFAAFCAHGVIPILAAATDAKICSGGECLPGPFFLTAAAQRLPSETEHANLSSEIYSWYTHNAASRHLAQLVHRLLGYPGTPA